MLYGSAPIAQALASARLPPGGGLGLRLTLRLARRPLWLAGLLADIGGFVLEALAFSIAPTTLVAPIMACDMLVFVLLCWPAFGRRPSVRGLTGATIMGLAVVVLGLAFTGQDEPGMPANDAQMIGFAVASLGTAAGAGVLGSRAIAARRRTLAAAAFSAGAGVSYGLATLATRQVGKTFSAGQPWELLVTPTPYVLAVCSLLGIALMQRGLQTGPALTFPMTSALAAFVPVLLGPQLLGDRVPPGAGRMMFIASLVLLGAGVVLIGADRSRGEMPDRMAVSKPNDQAG